MAALINSDAPAFDFGAPSDNSLINSLRNVPDLRPAPSMVNNPVGTERVPDALVVPRGVDPIIAAHPVTGEPLTATQFVRSGLDPALLRAMQTGRGQSEAMWGHADPRDAVANAVDALKAAADPDTWREAAQAYGHALLAGSVAPGAKVGVVDPVQHILSQIKADPAAKWGLRIVDEPIQGGVGSVLPPSRVWNDGKPTDQLLPGTSAVGIRGQNQKAVETALRRAGIAPYGNGYDYYPGQHVYLIKGASAAKGYDPEERIIPNAQIVSRYFKGDDGPSALQPTTGGAAAAATQGQSTDQ